MSSRAPAQSPSAAFKPRHSSPRSRLGLGKPLTATTTRRSVSTCAASRRSFLLLAPSLAAASAVLRTLPSAAAAESDDTDTPSSTPAPSTDELPSASPEAEADPEAQPEPDELPLSRVYDATVLGEPEALAGDARGRVWEKLAAARVVYLGEAELEPDPDDRALELEIVRGLAGRCADAGRGLALALEAFPCDLQQQLDQFMDGRIDGRILKLYTSHWPQELWQQYEPLLNYCRDTGIKLIACGTPLEDLQKGIDLGVVSPGVLQNFFDLEKYPLMAELIHRFQGFRERLLADPKFLQRLAIEEAISITTTLLAQYERRKGRFFEEIDYVLTDTIRGFVVDFFTVWLPAPTISVLQFADDGSGRSLEFVRGLLGSLPDNAFQKNILGQDWSIKQRIAAVLVGGLKLASVGFISSVGAGISSDLVYAARGIVKPSEKVEAGRKRAPIWKSAAVYSCFLGTSANLRYQIIAGLVEYRLGESLVTYYNQPLIAGLVSFVARTLNSYWGTQQWVDLARYTGLQKREEKPPSGEASEPPELELQKSEEKPPDEASTPPESAHLDDCSAEGHNLDNCSNDTNESSGQN